MARGFLIQSIRTAKAFEGVGEADKKEPQLSHVSFDDDPKTLANVIGVLDSEGYQGTLKHLVEVVCVPNIFSNHSSIIYDRIVEMLGPQKIKVGIVNALQKGTRRIFTAGDFCFEILQTCDRNKTRSYFSLGVYLMYSMIQKTPQSTVSILVLGKMSLSESIITTKIGNTVTQGRKIYQRRSFHLLQC
jgi:hypothetical protein